MEPELKKILTRVQKPGRYTGGEPGCVYKNVEANTLRFAFCFPDTYEVGMSYLGMKILYELLNGIEDVWCERAFMPWVDMAKEMKEHKVPLYALESKSPLSDFDMVGFTLQYELSYTNILAMLELGGIPLYSKERGENHPLVIGGGPCSCNAEPIADFFDILLLGEGEEQLPVICEVVKSAKEKGLDKSSILKSLSSLPGVYIPGFYTAVYHPDSRFKGLVASDGAPSVIRKALIQDFENLPLPENFVVPMVGAVHDRAQIEVLRGCVRGCRFCQAGFIYRPMRERDAAVLDGAARNLCDNTGFDEISLTSLSTSDHSQLEPLLDTMLEWTHQRHINMSLPSLRLDNFTDSLVQKVSKVRKSGLTFAPEAGTQRLRDVINKNITDEEIERSCTLAFDAGYSAVKLYFMIGLPTETMEDIAGIAETAQRVVELYYANPNRKKGQSVRVSVSVACFVPKPMTPFQFAPQDSREVLHKKQQYLLQCVKSKKISVSYHDSRTSFLEAVFAKGDRRLSRVIETAYREGCQFDGWDEHFRFETWLKAFEQQGISPEFYANQPIELEQATPWEHLDYGVKKEFLQQEYQRAIGAQTTPPCNRKCSACGASEMIGGPCFEYC